jgi:asparagine N-glycosylation enzyme membrane subunit Stt3
MMTLALLAVAGAAVCSGSAAVLQASAVSRLPQADSMSAGFVGRLARSPRYLLALVLVAAGFGLSILALRTLPLFVVQAGRASSLAITAVLSVLLLRVRLRTAEVIAVIGIGAGLVVVAATAGPQSTAEVGTAVRVGMLVAVLLIALTAAAALRIGNPHMPGWCWPSWPDCVSACSPWVHVCCTGSRRPSWSPTRPRGRWPAPAGSACCSARWRCSGPVW